MTILEVQQLKKIYKSKMGLVQYPALNGVSFEVSEGEFLGVMGPSGSGKTTLLNLLGTIDSPSSGNILVDGKEINNLKKKEIAEYRRKNIGFIFQDYNLLNTLTVKENIILPLALNNSETKVMMDKVNKLADDLNIKAILDKYPFEISGGQQQRTAAARAVITNPKIVLADEPTGNLDSKSSKELLDLLKFLNKQYKTTILMVTHDVFSAAYCDRILFIRDGKIFNELLKGEDEKEFFDKIIDMMTVLGGER